VRTKWTTRVAASIGAVVLAGAALFGPAALTYAAPPPLIARDFVESSPRGFGDRNNNWPPAMSWGRDHLYVGTSRAVQCDVSLSISVVAVPLFTGAVQAPWFPFPHRSPHIGCPPNAPALAAPGRAATPARAQAPVASRFLRDTVTLLIVRLPS